MRQLAARTAIVGGAGSRIGLGLARTFARQGTSVALCDIRDGRLEAALAEVRGLGNTPTIAVVGERMVRATRALELRVSTHMHARDWLIARPRRIVAALDGLKRWRTARSGHDPPLVPPHPRPSRSSATSRPSPIVQPREKPP